MTANVPGRDVETRLVTDYEIRIDEHAITTRSWTEPFLGRRRSDECACGWQAKGDAPDVVYLRAVHLANVRADLIVADVDGAA